MLNTTLLIKISKNINNDTQDIAKLLSNKIMTGMRYCSIKIDNEKDNIYFVCNDEDDVYIELLCKDKFLWFVNIYNHKEEDKDILIDTIMPDNTFESVIVVFDSISNKLLVDNYPILNQIENKLRSQFCFSILDSNDLEIFEIIDNLKVKDELRFDNFNIPQNLNTKLQRTELIELISYMNEHKLGGDEFKKYYDCFIASKIKREYSEFENMLRKDIFKGTISEIKNVSNIKNLRNAICHNNIVNINKFKDSITFINTIDEVITNKYILNLKKIFGEGISTNKHFALMFSDNADEFSLHNFILKFNQILNICGYIYDNSLECETFEEGNKKYYRLKQVNDDTIEINLSYISVTGNKDSFGVYVVCISFEDILEQNIIAELRDKLLNKIESSDITILNDYISTEYCNELYEKINYIENIVRAYISIFYFFKGLDLNKIGIDNGSNTNELSGNNNNKLYTCDFIYLSNILENPPESRKIVDLINQLRVNLKDGKYDIIENRLKNISDTNVDVGDIIELWTDLYKYRTIVAHSEYISKKEFGDITEIISNTLKIVEDVFFSELYNIFEFENKYSNDYKKELLEKDIGIGMDFKTGICTLKVKENNYKFEGIGMSRFQRLLRKIFDGNNIGDHSFILTIEAFKDWIDDTNLKFSDLISNNNYTTLINDEIVNLGYTKYVNHRIITTKEDILEEKIGKLLKSIETKIRKDEDEFSVTEDEV